MSTTFKCVFFKVGKMKDPTELALHMSITNHQICKLDSFKNCYDVN